MEFTKDVVQPRNVVWDYTETISWKDIFGVQRWRSRFPNGRVIEYGASAYTKKIMTTKELHALMWDGFEKEGF